MRGHLAVAKEQSVGIPGRGIEQKAWGKGKWAGSMEQGELSKECESASREGVRGILQRG